MNQWIKNICLGAGLGMLLAGCSTQKQAHLASQPNAIDQCWSQVSARSELANCLQKVLSDVGHKAELAEQQTAQQASQLDGMSTPNIHALKSFEVAKRSFHQFRERFCRWQETMAAAGGSGAGDGYRACYVETTRWWAQVLASQQFEHP
ncbi:hypothetical protein [Celerinatantimonas sp. YJH-8]|uniref:hypothetical protein n=1 Tax=Celerinatantimonas sp. YJH-8 TaxID=3228714 RepID=UPI0038C36229